MELVTVMSALGEIQVKSSEAFLQLCVFQGLYIASLDKLSTKIL